MNRKALTILELLIVIMGLSILLGVVTQIYFVGSNLWNEGLSRSDVRTDLAQALELISRNLRRATSINALTDSSITFTADLGSGSDTYRVYLYHASDPEPNPPYSESIYDLRWVQGTVTYGLGANLARDIAQPTSAVFSQDGNVISINLNVTRGGVSITMRTKVKPRNL